MLALETIHAGVSEMPYADISMLAAPFCLCSIDPYQVEDLALSHKVMKSVHDFLHAARPIPLYNEYSSMLHGRHVEAC